MGMLGKRRVVDDFGPGRTKQSMKDECDVNRILARYKTTGMIQHLAQGTPTYADVSDVGDYRTALERLRAADRWFSKLPARVRAEFRNDPAIFLDAHESVEGREVLVRLGLVKDPNAEEAPPAEPVEPPAQ